MHNRIALFRADRGVTRRELADAVGVNPQTIGFLERGDYKPFEELLAAGERPYEDRPGFERYAARPEPAEQAYRTFCGT